MKMQIVAAVCAGTALGLFAVKKPVFRDRPGKDGSGGQRCDADILFFTDGYGRAEKPV